MSVESAVKVQLQPRFVETNGSRHAVFDPIALDDLWASYASTSRDQTAPLLLDLAQVKYLDHDCLLYIASLVRFRALRRLETYIGLPDSRLVFEYLRAWDFPQMLGIVSGSEFGALLSRTDAERWAIESLNTPQYVEVLETPGGGREGMLMSKQLACTPIDIHGDGLRVATIAQERWRESQLIGILNLYLRGRGNRVPDQIVREVVLNAVHHPGASMAFTTAQFGRPPSWLGAAPARFQFGIWDDGLAMGETLRRAKKLGPIHSDGYGMINETFRVRLVRSNGGESLRVIDSKNAHLATDMPGFTVSAFLAGITSNPKDREANQFREQDEADVSATAGGFGLRHLRRNVIDLFGGIIKYRTGNYRLSMSSDGALNEYRVHIAYMPRSSWPLKGNLLSIDLPLNSGTAS